MLIDFVGKERAMKREAGQCMVFFVLIFVIITIFANYISLNQYTLFSLPSSSSSPSPFTSISTFSHFLGAQRRLNLHRSHLQPSVSAALAGAEGRLAVARPNPYRARIFRLDCLRPAAQREFRRRIDALHFWRRAGELL